MKKNKREKKNLGELVMKEKIAQKIFDYFSYDCTNEVEKDNLKNLIKTEIELGEKGIEHIQDWCINEYDDINTKYKQLHNLNDEEFEILIEEHGGCYEFMYNDMKNLEDLDYIWDLCNFYLDYLHGSMTLEKLTNLID